MALLCLWMVLLTYFALSMLFQTYAVPVVIQQEPFAVLSVCCGVWRKIIPTAR
jgi:hypothetical protein